MRSCIRTLHPKCKVNIEIRLPCNLLRLLPNLRPPLLRRLDNRRSAKPRKDFIGAWPFAKWEPFLQQLAKASQAHAAALVMHQVGPELHTVTASWGLDPGRPKENP